MNGPMFNPPGGGGGDVADAQTMAAVRSVCLPSVPSLWRLHLELELQLGAFSSSYDKACEEEVRLRWKSLDSMRNKGEI